MIEWALRPLGKVQPGEGVVTTLMLACVFLIFTSYYVMKTAREGLILTSGTFGLQGSELKAYANGAMAVLLIGIVPAYAALAHRVRRMRLIGTSYVLAIVSLLVFFVLARADVAIGLAFFIWLGMVSVLFVAQFWSYANDLYTEEQGKRLFAIIAVGGSLGAMVGPSIAKLAETYALMLVAAGLLVFVLAGLNLIEHLQRRQPAQSKLANLPITGPGAFELVFRDRYLLLICVMLFLANLVNTTGEYILANAVTEHAARLIPSTAHADLHGAAQAAAIDAERREWIKNFFASFYFWVNLVAFAIQAGLVSRVLQKCGVRRALFALPIVALGTYSVIALVGGLAVIRAVKITENGTDYSMQNTVRAALFLPTDRAVKYKAKAAIDTFFVRFGDTTAALLVGLGIHQLGLAVRGFSVVNVCLIVAWIVIARGVARHNGEREGKGVVS